MASKKPATKARKGTSTVRSSARKTAAHKVDARGPAVATRRQPPSRPAARVARAAAPARATKKSTVARAATPVSRPEGGKPVQGARPARPTGAASAPAPAARNQSPVAAEALSRPQTRPAARDELDGIEPSSLLAGPRNVKPYVAKRGEQYMGKQQLKHFQEILLNWKRDLMMEVDRTVTHMKDEAANFPDPNDRATQEEEFSLELRTRDRERKLIRKIDEALKRAEDGTYGYCLETGEEIGIKRLEARPVATLSLEAQERRERRERQYGDRDDRYR